MVLRSPRRVTFSDRRDRKCPYNRDKGGENSHGYQPNKSRGYRFESNFAHPDQPLATNLPSLFLSGSKDNPATAYTSTGLNSGASKRDISYKGKGKGRGKGKSNRNTYTPATKKGECPSASSTLTLDTATDFASAYAEGRFFEHALSTMAAQEFSAHRAARMSHLPIGGRLHEACHVWNLVDRKTFVPQVPHDGRNTPTSENGKEILNREVKAMLKKRAIRVADLKVPERSPGSSLDLRRSWVSSGLSYPRSIRIAS